MKTKIFITISLTVFISLLIIFQLKKENSETPTTSDNKIEFTERQKEIVNITEKYLKDHDVINENVSSFEITNLFGYGYYASKPSIYYIQVNFEYECKKNLEECLSIDNLENKDDFNFWNFNKNRTTIFIELKDNQILNILSGMTINIDSDFIQASEIE